MLPVFMFNQSYHHIWKKIQISRLIHRDYINKFSEIEQKKYTTNE